LFKFFEELGLFIGQQIKIKIIIKDNNKDNNKSLLLMKQMKQAVREIIYIFNNQIALSHHFVKS